MSPFDTQVYHEHQICLRFHRILKVILEMAFSSHCTPIWKLNIISVTIINKVTRKCIWCCHRAQRCVTSPGFGVKLCSGAWKRGPDSHVGTFSLWLGNDSIHWIAEGLTGDTERCKGKILILEYSPETMNVVVVGSSYSTPVLTWSTYKITRLVSN